MQIAVLGIDLGKNWDCPGSVDTNDALQRGVPSCPRPVPRMPLSSVVR
jgi:hypothetical protein